MRFIYGRKVLQAFFRKLYFFSLKGMNYNLVGSGEENILKQIFSNVEIKKKYIIFDVGANVGEYTSNLLKVVPKESTIYSFEPSISTFKILDNTIKDIRVVKVNSGLGNEIGMLKFYNSEFSTLSSFVDLKGKNGDFDEVPIDTIDNFCQNNGIDKIDFLKIDVEGFDLNVIKGAIKLMEKGKIEFIQFEFGGTNISTKVFMKDFWEILHPNYHIHRILKDGFIEIEEYTEFIEIFAYSNYLAIKK